MQDKSRAEGKMPWMMEKWPMRVGRILWYLKIVGLQFLDGYPGN